MYLDDIWILSITALVIILALTSLILSGSWARMRKAKKQAELDASKMNIIASAIKESSHKQLLQGRTMDISVETRNDIPTVTVGLFNAQDLTKFSRLIPLIKGGTNIEISGNFFVSAHTIKYLAEDTWAIKDLTNDTPWEVTSTLGLSRHFDNATTSI